MPSPKPVRFRVVDRENGNTLVVLLARRLPGGSADAARNLIKAGAVYLGHLRVRIPGQRVVTGERVTVYPAAEADQELGPESVVFVHRDPSFVVLDKPAGIPVAQTKHSARGTLAEALRRVLSSEGVLRPYVGVVHRLDQGASGLILFTIRGVANKSLHRQFVDHTIGRTYRVLLRGDGPLTARCDAPLIEKAGGGVEVAREGQARAKPATSEFRKLEARAPRDDASLYEVELTTGRTHQIRVHAAELGHPVVGDRRYGPDAAEDSRLHLHAHKLAFEHPIDGSAIALESELPPWAVAT